MSPKPIITHHCPIQKLGQSPYHHFFGYYNKSTWSRDGRYILANRVDMMTKDLGLEDCAEVGFYAADNPNGEFTSLGRTTTWNWQMGCQSQWLDQMPGRKAIFNVRDNNPNNPYPDFASEIVDADSGERRRLPLPVYVTAQNSQYALCVDYRRLFITHETIGYQAPEQYTQMSLAPEDDGIYYMDLATGEYRLVCTYHQLTNFHPVASMDKAAHWVSHIEIAPDFKRVLFLHRWSERVEDETCFLHRLISMNPDGSEMYLLECSDHPIPQLQDDFDANAVGTFDYEKSEWQISHPTWQGNEHIMVWGPHQGSIHYHLYKDKTQHADVVGEGVLDENGHMTYSPDGRWMVSDTYPDDTTHERILFLYDMKTDQRYDIGSFYADPNLGKINRCDLHPRWNHDGTQVCIDSVHENQRQMYLIDVSEIVGRQ
ncbi:hypothetical protein [Paraferrimonas sedimenticola]|uniref:Uncharacterized protein n=1 Tax=Paraferrimonas sedimenticola TaxID=375674 RepID=A0AA37VT18_9GAMM|nr:hypothetical protein [Paraferrimonas sedimenticola]GLP95124.1 hypothetical protein GCM10007895_04300 [Paraferrimonas sedimenticola]